MKHPIVLPEPPSANRWWRRAGNHMHLSSEARDYKTNLERMRKRIVKGPVKVSLDWYRGRKSGDLDKRIGIALDAMQGVFFENDSQVVELIARRFDDPKNPRIEVRVEAVA